MSLTSLKDRGRKAFDAWEMATAERLERWTKSPVLLAPIGLLITQSMRAKERADRQMSTFWTGIGLAGKRDQERVLFALAQLESRLLDLEEKLDLDRAMRARHGEARVRDHATNDGARGISRVPSTTTRGHTDPSNTDDTNPTKIEEG